MSRLGQPLPTTEICRRFAQIRGCPPRRTPPKTFVFRRRKPQQCNADTQLALRRSQAERLGRRAARRTTPNPQQKQPLHRSSKSCFAAAAEQTPYITAQKNAMLPQQTQQHCNRIKIVFYIKIVFTSA